MTYPYDDEYLVYDYDEHRYILTPKAVLDKLNLNLIERLNVGGAVNRERVPYQFLDEISDIVYTEIYNYSSQPEIQEYQIAKLPSARKVIMQAMLRQVDYALVNGFLDQYSGIDLKKNSKVDDLSGRYLAPRAKSVLSKPLLESKVPLLYAGKYAMIFRPNYEEMGY